MVERKNLVEITFPERRLGTRSTISECFLGNSRLASWIRHGPARLYISSRLPLSVHWVGGGGFARAPAIHALLSPRSPKLPLHLPLPYFVSRIFTIFPDPTRSYRLPPRPIFSFSPIFPPSFPSVNAVRRLHSSVIIYRNVDGIKMFWASESRVVQPIERKWKGVKGKTPPLSRVQPNIIVLIDLKTIAALRNWQSRKSVIIAM